MFKGLRLLAIYIHVCNASSPPPPPPPPAAFHNSSQICDSDAIAYEILQPVPVECTHAFLLTSSFFMLMAMLNTANSLTANSLTANSLQMSTLSKLLSTFFNVVCVLLFEPILYSVFTRANE